MFDEEEVIEVGRIYWVCHKSTPSKEIVKVSYYTDSTLISYCNTKYDNQNKETKHLLKLFGSDM